MPKSRDARDTSSFLEEVRAALIAEGRLPTEEINAILHEAHDGNLGRLVQACEASHDVADVS